MECISRVLWTRRVGPAILHNNAGTPENRARIRPVSAPTTRRQSGVSRDSRRTRSACPSHADRYRQDADGNARCRSDSPPSTNPVWSRGWRPAPSCWNRRRTRSEPPGLNSATAKCGSRVSGDSILHVWLTSTTVLSLLVSRRYMPSTFGLPWNCYGSARGRGWSWSTKRTSQLQPRTGRQSKP